jgi:type II secretory pathway pseudopilin PulG
MKNTPTKSNCFTIVELLLVIVIIAILSALLLPSLQQAKAKSTSITCLSNLKQLGVSYNQYLSLYNRTVPVYSNSKRWYNFLMPYITSSNENTTNLPQVLSCPNDYRKDKVIDQSNTTLSFGINQCYSPFYKDNKEYKLWYGINAKNIANPSKFIAISDSVNYYIGNVIDSNVYGNVNGQLAVLSGWAKNLSFRHGNIKRLDFNSVFADGHCGSLIFDENSKAFFDLKNQGDYL